MNFKNFYKLSEAPNSGMVLSMVTVDRINVTNDPTLSSKIDSVKEENLFDFYAEMMPPNSELRSLLIKFGSIPSVTPDEYLPFLDVQQNVIYMVDFSNGDSRPINRDDHREMSFATTQKQAIIDGYIRDNSSPEEIDKMKSMGFHTT